MIVNLRRKILKAIAFVNKFDVFKTLYWRKKLRLGRASSFHICPKSIVEIDNSAEVIIPKGELVVNDSWFPTRKRRYVSEFRLDKDSVFVCEGDFKILQGASIYVAPGAKLILHGRSGLNTNCTLNCFHHIEIGEGCGISDNVCIADSDNHSLDGRKEKVTAPIRIGNHVLIGRNATIMKGVTIGDWAVVGACSVVTKDVPCHTVVVGNPAKPIKTIEKWE